MAGAKFVREILFNHVKLLTEHGPFPVPQWVDWQWLRLWLLLCTIRKVMKCNDRQVSCEPQRYRKDEKGSPYTEKKNGSRYVWLFETWTSSLQNYVCQCCVFKLKMVLSFVLCRNPSADFIHSISPISATKSCWMKTRTIPVGNVSVISWYLRNTRVCICGIPLWVHLRLYNRNHISFQASVMHYLQRRMGTVGTALGLKDSCVTITSCTEFREGMENEIRF